MAGFDETLNALLSDQESMGKIMQLAQSLSADNGQSPQPSAPAPPPSPESSSPLSALAGGTDPGLFQKLLPLVQALNSEQDSRARQLLYALRPYLQPQRQEKVERALQLARLIHAGRGFLSGWRG